MPMPRVLVVLSVVAGLLSVAAAMIDAPGLSMQCGAAAFAALAAYGALAGKAWPQRVRWAVTAGLVLFAVVWATRAHWQMDQTVSPLDPAGIREQTAQRVEQSRLAALGLLAGAVAFASAVFALPPVRHAQRAALGAVLVFLLIVAIGMLGRGSVDNLRTVPPLWVSLPALLAVVVTLATVALTGWREDRGWLITVGAPLLAVVAVVNLDNLAALWWTWRSVSDSADGASGRSYTSVLVVTGVGGRSLLYDGLATAVTLAGPILLAVGALRTVTRRAV